MNGEFADLIDRMHDGLIDENLASGQFESTAVCHALMPAIT
jgi:hypothetical protein